MDICSWFSNCSGFCIVVTGKFRWNMQRFLEFKVATQKTFTLCSTFPARLGIPVAPLKNPSTSVGYLGIQQAPRKFPTRSVVRPGIVKHQKYNLQIRRVVRRFSLQTKLDCAERLINHHGTTWKITELPGSIARYSNASFLWTSASSHFSGTSTCSARMTI